MKRLILNLSMLLVMATTVHATFSKFVHIRPGIEKEKPQFGRYSIGEIVITQVDDDRFRVTISRGRNPNPRKRFWKILCSTPCSRDQLKFRDSVWRYEQRKKDIEELINAGLKRDEAVKIIDDNYSKLNIKARTDIESIELLPATEEDKIVTVEIPLDEITRTYIYRDFPMMIMDGGHYYCIDIPEYFKQYSANQNLQPTPLNASDEVDAQSGAAEI